MAIVMSPLSRRARPRRRRPTRTTFRARASTTSAAASSWSSPATCRSSPRRPASFWVAADTHERANGRTYTEVQIALPRELNRGEREELARQATRELLGDRFAYTMAIHTPLAQDNLDQPHMHLMFSERAIDETTRGIAEERFFKRNGAKKDPAWNAREKPIEVREKWVEMMNGAMQKAGLDQRLDARSWAAQGREDLAALVEPKLLGGEDREAQERRSQSSSFGASGGVAAPHLDQATAIESWNSRPRPRSPGSSSGGTGK